MTKKKKPLNRSSVLAAAANKLIAKEARDLQARMKLALETDPTLAPGSIIVDGLSALGQAALNRTIVARTTVARPSIGHIINVGPERNRFLNALDDAHKNFDIFGKDIHPFVKHIWAMKYKWRESSPAFTFQRVAAAIYKHDTQDHAQEAFECMSAGLWMPGGRILAGAGTEKRVTLMNCYVNRTLDDALDSIMEGLQDAALTQQMGGGIGTDFSTLRPTGALLQRTGSKASGPLPFMDMWHSMCATIMSAGDRRGAMMGTLCDTHPDLPEFIKAKQQKGRLTNFNVSVLVSDAFMEAVKEDADWDLFFSVPKKDDADHLESPAGAQSVPTYFEDEKGVIQYVYSTWKARDLWKLITENTYEWSEPGVIFVDRINELNNLNYCEIIRCTNPCGEQPLPPNATCNLGAVNLARLVRKPFTTDASFDFHLLSQVVRVGMRFLDNVIDVTEYPLEIQKAEELSKRRTGLGVSGLADALAQMGLRYGSRQALDLTEKIMECICQRAYSASCVLAEERGSFPLLDGVKYTENTFAGIRVDFDTQFQIRSGKGIRNGVLLTVAPTGTTSILYGNISSGIEPVFAHEYERRILQNDNTHAVHNCLGYNAALHERLFPGSIKPPAMVTVDDLTVEDHITTQAAVQRWVDASVSKTVNLAEDITYEEFLRVYDLAYALGCKGCTTYKPSDVRGAVLIKPTVAGSSEVVPVEKLMPRPTLLTGATHKLRWPSMSSALYLTINYDEVGNPFEVFFQSKDGRHHDWMTTTSLLITSILRRGGNISFMSDELKAVHSFGDTAFIKLLPTDDKPTFFGSLPAYIGAVLEQYLQPRRAEFTELPAGTYHLKTVLVGHKEVCPSCHQPTLQRLEGCKTCSCGYSDCG